MTLRRRLPKFKLVRFFSSVKLTVVCLCLLFILTMGGTIAQIQEGLYAAQQHYFESFFFLAFGFLPFPGAQTVMWVLFSNLIIVALTRFVYKWHNIGILIIHSGLLLFLISAYITFHEAKESHLTLMEGQASNVSTAYHDWELVLWEPTGQTDPLITNRDITSIDANYFKPGQTISLDKLKLKIRIDKYYKNCDAYAGMDGRNIISVSGIVRLEPAQLFKEPERNTPGGFFTIRTDQNKTFEVLLYGGETKPITIKNGSKTYAMLLRLKHYPLPFILKLKEFKKEDHPGTDMARSFQSVVEIQVDRVWREKLISMNEPLRYKDFTFYQASFSVDKKGMESSTLAVVKNSGRLMPYISTFVTFMGLVMHFSMMAVLSRKRKA